MAGAQTSRSADSLDSLDSARDAETSALWRQRPRNRAARVSVAALVGLAIYAWWGGGFNLAALVTERAQHNAAAFLNEVRPYPLQGRDWDWSLAAQWVADTLSGRGGEAFLITLCVSFAAIVLAAAVGAVLSLGASRALATAEPFLPAARAPSRTVRALFGAQVAFTRAFLIFLRAIPEYVWAFLLLTLFGLGAWPAVLALALHNSGILGKLFAEVIEDVDSSAPGALRGLGASRLGVAAAAILPISLGRFLLFFFYRWETCVREATVLGLLGFAGLGYHVIHSYAAMRYDEMLLFVLLGSLLIFAGDLVSAGARLLVRRAGG